METLLASWAYPFEWATSLLEQCVARTVEVNGRPVVAFWAHYAVSSAAAEFHIAADPSASRGLAVVVVPHLFEFFGHLRACGVKVVLARATTPGHLSQLRRLGFTDAGVFAYLEL